MRQQLDIYASVVVCKSIRGAQTRHNNVDFAIIRENTEGEYSGLEHQSYPGVVESLKVSTRDKAERICRFAFDFALKNGRQVRSLVLYMLIASAEFFLKKVTCVHKANIMKLGDGLFLNTFRHVAEEYKSSGIAYNDMIVDNTFASPFTINYHICSSGVSTARCSLLQSQVNSMSWSCPTFMVQSFQTLVLLWLAALGLFLDAILDENMHYLNQDAAMLPRTSWVPTKRTQLL